MNEKLRRFLCKTCNWNRLFNDETSPQNSRLKLPLYVSEIIQRILVKIFFNFDKKKIEEKINHKSTMK